MKKSIDKKRAFTLAEVMMSFMLLAVIGVMLIPTLNEGVTDVPRIAKFKKVYAQLREAHRAVMQLDVPNGDVSFDSNYANNNAAYRDAMFKYLNVSRTCLNNAGDVCWPNSYYYLNGTISQTFSSTQRVDVLADGTAIYFKTNAAVCDDTTKISCDGGNSIMETVFIDVNGPEMPNTYGRDIFLFMASKDELVAGHTGSGYGQQCSAAIARGETLTLDGRTCGY